MNILEKFQLIWKCLHGTSFTALPNGQKLENIVVDEWMNGLS
jgi:hypothetical protein